MTITVSRVSYQIFPIPKNILISFPPTNSNTKFETRVVVLEEAATRRIIKKNQSTRNESIRFISATSIPFNASPPFLPSSQYRLTHHPFHPDVSRFKFPARKSPPPPSTFTRKIQSRGAIVTRLRTNYAPPLISCGNIIYKKAVGGGE